MCQYLIASYLGRVLISLVKVVLMIILCLLSFNLLKGHLLTNLTQYCQLALDTSKFLQEADYFRKVIRTFAKENSHKTATLYWWFSCKAITVSVICIGIIMIYNNLIRIFLKRCNYRRTESLNRADQILYIKYS